MRIHAPKSTGQFARVCLCVVWFSLGLVQSGADGLRWAVYRFDELVVESNRDFASARQQLGETEAQASKIFRLDSTSVSVSGSYSYQPDADGSEHGGSGGASVSVPVLPQIRISGSVNVSGRVSRDPSGSASMSLSLSPLAGLGSDLVTERQLATQRLSLSFSEVSLRWQARAALLQHSLARRAAADARESADLAWQHYEQVQARNREGLSSQSALQEAANRHSSRSNSYIAALRQLSTARKRLHELSGVVVIEPELLSVEVSREDLLSLVADARTLLAETSAVYPYTSLSRENLELQKHFAERQLADIWAIEPSVSVSASGSLSDVFADPSGSAGASLSLQFSAASFNFDEIRDLQAQIADLELDLRIERLGLAIDEENARRSVRTAEFSVEVAARNLSAAEESYARAAESLELGDISLLEYRTAALDRDQAETGYLSALASLYSQLGTLMRSYAAPPEQS